MQGMGVKGLYMTPHIIHGAYDNRGEEELRQRFADFGYQGPLDIRLGAEYFIDDKFPEHLEGNPLTMNCRHVLVEFSINGYSLRAFDMLFEATFRVMKSSSPTPNDMRSYRPTARTRSST